MFRLGRAISFAMICSFSMPGCANVSLYDRFEKIGLGMKEPEIRELLGDGRVVTQVPGKVIDGEVVPVVSGARFLNGKEAIRIF